MDVQVCDLYGDTGMKSLWWGSHMHKYIGIAEFPEDSCMKDYSSNLYIVINPPIPPFEPPVGTLTCQYVYK